MPYPTITDVSEYLAARGFTFSQSLQPYLDAAITEWEQATGFVPFLASDTDSTAYYRIYGPVVDLRTGFASVTSVKTVDPETLDERDTLDERVHYDPIRQGSATVGVRLLTKFKAGGMLAVTGRQGYSLALPSDAWLAIVAESARLAMSAAAQDFQSVREGDVSVTLAEAGTVATRLFARAVKRYRRVGIGYAQVPIGS